MTGIFEKFFKGGADKNSNEKPSEKKKISADPKCHDEISEASEAVEKNSATVNRTRNKTMNLRFSPSEIDEMNEKILKSGLTKTEFILKCVRNQPVIVVPNLSETMTEIRKQGVNLNQMAKALNEYALELKSYGVRMNNENATWRAITIELEGLREENLRTQEMMATVQEKLDEAIRGERY